MSLSPLVVPAAAIALLCAADDAAAQVPAVVNYQGKLTDNTGAALNNNTNVAADGRIEVRFNLYDTATVGVGTPVWSQAHPNVMVSNGLFSVLLSGLDTTVITNNNVINRWLEVVVMRYDTADALIASNTLAPRKELVSVPYAIRAWDADMVDGLHASAFVTNWLGLTNVGMPPDLADGLLDYWASVTNKPYAVSNWANLITNGMPLDLADGQLDWNNVTNKPNLLTSETDPTVVGWVKDGESWQELVLTGTIPTTNLNDGAISWTELIEKPFVVTNWANLKTNGMPWFLTNDDWVSWSEISNAPSFITNWANLITNGMPPDLADGLLDYWASVTNKPYTISNWANLKTNGMPWFLTNDDWVSWGEISNKPSIVTTETDPTVSNWVKDGVTWNELKQYGAVPAGFTDDVDNVGILFEVDPQVDTNKHNYVPRWDRNAGSYTTAQGMASGALVYGQIYDDWDNQRVGIGTENPNYPFHVSRSTADYLAVLQNPYNGAVLYLGYGGGQGAIIETGSGNGTYALQVSKNWNPLFTVRGDTAKVGLGVSNPSAKLHVVSPSTADEEIVQRWNYDQNIGASEYSLKLRQDVEAGVVRWVYDQMNNGASYPAVLSLDRGNVGIGTATPQQKLHVGGSAAIGGYLGIGTPSPAYQLDLLGGGMRIRNNNASSRLFWSREDGSYPMGVNSDGYGTMRFMANGAEWMALTPGGNMGIGTLSPQAKLQVGDAYGLTLNPNMNNNGDGALFHNAYVLWSLTGDYRWLTSHGSFGSRGIQFGYGDGIKFYADQRLTTAGAGFTPTERMRISNEGNVGIGTTSPGAKLHVNGQIKITDGSQANNYVLTSDGNGLATWKPVTGGGGPETDPQVADLTENAVPRWDASLKLVDGAIYNNTAGQVTIGANSFTSGYKLEIYDGKMGVRNNSDDYRYAWARTDGTHGGGLGSDGYGKMYFSTENAVRMTLDGSGNLGIGYDSPAYKLSVNGGAFINGSTYINGNGFVIGGLNVNGIASIYGGVLRTEYGDCRMESSEDPQYPGTGRRQFLALRAMPSSTPSSLNPMTVLVPANGGFRVTDANNSIYDMDVRPGGNLYIRGTLSQGSDSRFKFNQEALDYGLAELMLLEPKRFDRADWTIDPTNGVVFDPATLTNDIGLVAQEVYKVIPEVARPPVDENSDIWTIAYSKLIPVIIKAIQEQQTEIESLQPALIEELRKTVQEQLRRIEEQERRIEEQQQKIESQQDQIDSQQQTINKLTDQVGVQQQMIESPQQNYADLLKRIEALENK